MALRLAGEIPGVVQGLDSQGWLRETRGLVASSPTLVVKGASGQSANLQEWQDNGSTVLAFVTRDGYVQGKRVHVDAGGYVGTPNGNHIYFFNNLAMAFQAPVRAVSAASVGLRIYGATGQTGDLQRWEDPSNVVLASVDKDGTIVSTVGLRTKHEGAATPTGGASGEMRLGNGKIWVNDAGTWKSVAVA